MIFARVAILLCFALGGQGAYKLVDEFKGEKFFQEFKFFTGNDPTHGYVDYVADRSLAYVRDNGNVKLKVDTSRVASGRGRKAIRLESKHHWEHGLFVLDAVHLPTGCGVWPAWWSHHPGSWPYGGEIDVIEYVNKETKSHRVLHTADGCTMHGVATKMTGTFSTKNCYVGAHDQANNAGCGITSNYDNSAGAGFNAIRGGITVMELDPKNHVKTWFFPSGTAPADLVNGTPNPSSWKTPDAHFPLGSNCHNIFRSQMFIINTTMCGDWAGAVFGSQCKASTGTSDCKSFVKNNPQAFAEAYWEIKNMRVYQGGSSAGGSGGNPVVPVEPSTGCTAAGNDPYSSGREVPCCAGSQKQLKDWYNNGHWFYKCESTGGSGFGGNCTPAGQDPYSSGSKVDCCSGHAVVGDWNHNGNWFYICQGSSAWSRRRMDTVVNRLYRGVSI